MKILLRMQPEMRGEMPGDQKLAIVIPAYNEADNIATVIRKIKAVLQPHPADIIVVDDGSTDHTRGIARREGAIVLPHAMNMGYGCALKTGLTFAWEKAYDRVVTLDADGQHDPQSIPALLEPLESATCEIVMGSRFLGTQPSAVPFLRRCGQRFFSWLLWLTTRERVTDPTTGFHAIGYKALWLYASDLFPDDYPDANFMLVLHRAGLRWREVPARFLPRERGKSMHSNPLRSLYYMLRVSLSMLLTLLRAKPKMPECTGGRNA